MPCADTNIDHLGDRIGGGAYSALMDVVEADRRLTAADRSLALDALVGVITRHGLQEEAGIRLLHRHCALDEDEVMVERERDGVGGPSLVTAPELSSALGGDVAPNSWRFVGGRWSAVEHSADAVVAEAALRLRRSPAFLSEFGGALERLGLGDTLGLAVAPRSFYDRHRPAGDMMLNEATDEGRRANVVRYRPVSEVGTALQTVWVVTDSLQATSCPTLQTMHCSIKITCNDDVTGHPKSKVDHDREYIDKHMNG